VTYVLDPLVAGQLGERTDLDASTHPPVVRQVDYVVDLPTDEDLIQSFPVFLVSDDLAGALTAANLTGFRLDNADVRASDQYGVFGGGDVPLKQYRWLRLDSSDPADCWLDERFRLCVSDEMYAVISSHRIERCEVTKTN
jgi:hypothetical protein